MRRRILLAILLAVAVTAAALGIPLGYTALVVVESLKQADLVDSAQSLAANVDNLLAADRKLDLSAMRAGLSSDAEIVLNTPMTGRISSGPDLNADVLTAVVPIVHGGTVALSVPAGPTRQLQIEFVVFVVLLVVLSVGTGTVVATVTARRLTEPLRHVADRASRLGAGDFRPDPNRYGVSELDSVAEALDTSASALAQLVQRERDLVGDVSHQLRSRLTALQLRLEALAAAPNPETREDATAALEQAERLANVLDELLAAASAARSVGAQPIDLNTELPVIAAEWRELLRAEGRSLRVRVPDTLMARATPARLREALGVLLDNALRHGVGPVIMSARRGEGEGTVVVEVTDAGPGVPDDLAAHVFERGVSGGGSTGVGLALARALVDADGGRLELSTLRPATFAVFLPVATVENVVATPWRSSEPSSPR
ncbi:MAG TPA: ATP-binding protein [Pseudonocardiaceae bacterium]|nr:ATP-binding protein [Pseudonocardiaceae bacterium]